jgi:hypothetical protein
MSSIIKIAVIFAMFGKDFTDPRADCVRDYNNSFSGRGRNSNGGYIGEILAITIYGFQWNGFCRQP